MLRSILLLRSLYSCSYTERDAEVEVAMRSQSGGDGTSSSEPQVHDRLRHPADRRVHFHHRFHRRSLPIRRPTCVAPTAGAAARDVIGDADDDVIGVSRGRQRDHVLPVRVQLHGEAVLGGRRRRY